MTASIVSPFFLEQVIPYNLLGKGRKPSFGNSSVEKFLVAAAQALAENHPDSISLVIAVAPGKQLVPKPWQRRYKPEAINFYTFFNKGNAFGAIEILSKILAEAYGESKILALIIPCQVPKDVGLLSEEIRGNLAASGCILYSNLGVYDAGSLSTGSRESLTCD